MEEQFCDLIQHPNFPFLQRGVRGAHRIVQLLSWPDRERNPYANIERENWRKSSFLNTKPDTSNSRERNGLSTHLTLPLLLVIVVLSEFPRVWARTRSDLTHRVSLPVVSFAVLDELRWRRFEIQNSSMVSWSFFFFPLVISSADWFALVKSVQLRVHV